MGAHPRGVHEDEPRLGDERDHECDHDPNDGPPAAAEATKTDPAEPQLREGWIPV